jgi:hypothetical protein
MTWITLTCYKTPLSVHHGLSRNPEWNKVTCVQRDLWYGSSVPIVRSEQNPVTFWWWRNDLHHYLMTMHPQIYCHMLVTRHGVFICNWIKLQIVTTSNYDAIVNSRNRLLNTAHAVFSVCYIFTSRCLLTDLNNALFFRAYVLIGWRLLQL